jgi:hypothetical protein
MNVEDELRKYKTTLDAATETAARRPNRVIAMRRIRPVRSVAIAVVAVAATIGIAFAAVGVTHHSSTSPAGVNTSTTPTSASSPATAVPTITAPDLVGMREGDAVSAVGRLTLRIAVAAAAPACTAPGGTVVTQTPVAGTLMEYGATVTVDICHPPSAGTTITLPVVGCTTELGVPPSQSDPHAPTSLTIAAPSFTTTALEGYSDLRGFMPVVAPAGWNCKAIEATDGGQGVGVTPPGATPRNSWGSGTTVTQPPTDGIFASWDPACQGCVYGEICGIVPSADADFPDYAANGLCGTPPAGQTVTPLGNNLYAIDDPAGALGPDAAHSLLRYTPKTPTTDASAIRETCILPVSQRAVCTALLDDFMAFHHHFG